MAFRGERFVPDLDDGSPDDLKPMPFDLVGEIREREPTSANPSAPAPPTPTASSTGFPAHRKRNKISSFKQRRAQQEGEQDKAAASITESSPPSVQDDKQTIAEENRRHLASMSETQIKHEQEELIASMDQSLIERFLRRAKIEDPGHETSEEPRPASATEIPAASKPKKSVSFDIPAAQPTTAPKPSIPVATSPKAFAKPRGRDDAPPTQTPSDLHPASERPSLDPAVIEPFHFPQPSQPMPTLDPSSPNFLSDLQSHYFPEITHDPTALSWLQPPPDDEEDPASTSAYHPASSAISIAPSAIRFSLRGSIIAPNTSLSLPTTLGLHHHGEDPHAAGYTIPELAILSRSTFPAQRCIAWQVLGRILFRLGRDEFGERGGQLSEGLWFVIEKEGVVGGMLAEAEGVPDPQTRATKEQEEESGASATPLASGIGRHASATAWATEGVWLWQKGGGGDRGLLKEGQSRPR
ncbi:uncharacterized protein N7477_006554 [Penicillium maclennaniae]|uniref:uncharacterized protein n=1 Tax=Penicillium maclennaniae TaxID=1343394 RepID=UPI0025401D10|nr:uncharacterized protein N7477_006554 [Penicillium maclennaniae]KAJ5667984.1 hypothetical protein N7477_006554 [Penicillium maclennaniae]